MPGAGHPLTADHLVHLLTAAAQPLTRDGARRAARDELAKAAYHRDDPPWWLRPLRDAVQWLRHVISSAADATGGYPALAAIVVAVLVGAAVVLWRVGPLAPGRRVGDAFAPPPESSADDHRRRADERARDAQWADAVRERLRAVLRELEQRGVLDRRTGRTATEVARDGGAALPALRGGLAGAAETFNTIWYGGRPATAEDYRRLVEVDEAVRAAHVPAAGVPGPGVPGPGVPAAHVPAAP